MHFELYLTNKICLNLTEFKMLKTVASTLNLGLHSLRSGDAASIGTVA